MRLERHETFVVGALVYLACGALWIYGVLDKGLLEDRPALGWSVIALVAAAHVAFGYVIREWATLLLPIALVLLAIPAGYPESRYSEPGPLWFGQGFHALFEVVLIAVGLGLQSLVTGRWGGHRPSQQPRTECPPGRTNERRILMAKNPIPQLPIKQLPSSPPPKPISTPQYPR